MIHSLAYRLGYTVKQSYCCLFVINALSITPVNKYEFLLHIFSFLVSGVSYMDNAYSVLCPIGRRRRY